MMFLIFIVCSFQSFDVFDWTYGVFSLFQGLQSLIMCTQTFSLNVFAFSPLVTFPWNNSKLFSRQIFSRSKSYKTWHFLTSGAFFYNMYKVNNPFFPIIQLKVPSSHHLLLLELKFKPRDGVHRSKSWESRQEGRMPSNECCIGLALPSSFCYDYHSPTFSAKSRS